MVSMAACYPEGPGFKTRQGREFNNWSWSTQLQDTFTADPPICPPF